MKRTRFAPLLLAWLVAACSPDSPQAPEPTAENSKDVAAKSAKATPGSPEAIRAATTAVDDGALRLAGRDTANWLTHGRTYSETRYSPLDQIRADNVAKLGLAWYFETGTKRGHEATPIVVDGVLYTTAPWSVVYALDARTGKLLWKHDPQVPKETGAKACCDVVNRGVALYKGRVFVGTLDGRLLALDAATGERIWEQVTVDQSRPYTITGAPRIVKGKVIIGNGGAEYGVRGYISAYNWKTGDLQWRFYTVPGDPSKPFESPALEKAAATWSGGEWWKVGGGGTVWDSMAFDPELDLLYVGTGNGSPWNRYLRSPGGGDNLYVSSILALRPDTGKLVWYYQETPGDKWDYTATQHMILADLEIGGQLRKVLMHAPKNGFFYVIDRTNGQLVSAEPFVEVTWAERIDHATGRPVEAAGTDYRKEIVTVKPAPFGAHNWHPMSFNPQTGLVYIPAQDIPYLFKHETDFDYKPGAWNLGIDFSVADSFPRELVSGHLLAWDPVKQQEVWRAQYTGPWNGGTLTTAGNLVFQGTAHGTFVAYRANDGKQLWETPAGTGIVAAPVTYQVNGEQYVSVMAGWGGAFPLAAGDAAAAAGQVNRGGRLLTYKLGGTQRLPLEVEEDAALAAVPIDIDPGQVKTGSRLYARWCSVCHGAGVVGAGVLPDLRKSMPETYAVLPDIVLRGIYRGKGMPAFDAWLGEADVAAIRSYVLSRRAELRAQQAASSASADPS